MPLKTAKTVVTVLSVLTMVLILLAESLGSKMLGILGIAVAFAAVIFWWIFGRCHICGAFLGRSPDKFCRQCGGKLK